MENTIGSHLSPEEIKLHDVQTPKNKERELSVEEETPGEVYVGNFFHPHPELPEEIPEAISEIIAKEQNPIALGEAGKLWNALRSGYGSLLLPESRTRSWDNFAAYINQHIAGNNAPLVGGAGDFNSDVLHWFRNMSFFLPPSQIDLRKPTTGIELEIRNIIRRPNYGEDGVKFIKHQINTGIPTILSELKLIEIARAQRAETAKGLPETERNYKSKQAYALMAQIVNPFSGEEDSIDDEINMAVAAAHEVEELNSLPWYICLAALPIAAEEYFNEPICNKINDTILTLVGADHKEMFQEAIRCERPLTFNFLPAKYEELLKRFVDRKVE